MGQILKQDKIGALSHNAGDITLQVSTLTIGGQQYSTSSLTRTIATDLSMAANTRYQIYAVVSGGVVVLRISVNENSVGPAGFNSWKLVGSFMSNGSSTFGGFLKIEATPSSDWIDSGVISVDAFTTAPTKGTTSRDKVFVKREGEFVLLKYEYRQTSSGTTGSGVYKLRMPTGLQIDTTKVYASTGATDLTTDVVMAGIFSSGMSTQTTENRALQAIVYDADYFTVQTYHGSGNARWNSTTHNLSNAAFSFTLTVRVPVLNWSNTPIEDL